MSDFEVSRQSVVTAYGGTEIAEADVVLRAEPAFDAATVDERVELREQLGRFVAAHKSE